MSLREHAPPALRQPPPADRNWPKVVASSFKPGSVAALATTGLVSVRESGLYRFQASARCTTGGDAITLSASAVYTDAVGAATTASFTGFTLAATGRVSGSVLLIRAAAGSTISWSTAISGARVASVWDVDATLERLS